MQTTSSGSKAELQLYLLLASSLAKSLMNQRTQKMQHLQPEPVSSNWWGASAFLLELCSQSYPFSLLPFLSATFLSAPHDFSFQLSDTEEFLRLPAAISASPNTISPAPFSPIFGLLSIWPAFQFQQLKSPHPPLPASAHPQNSLDQELLSNPCFHIQSLFSTSISPSPCSNIDTSALLSFNTTPLIKKAFTYAHVYCFSSSTGSLWYSATYRLLSMLLGMGLISVPNCSSILFRLNRSS